MLPHRSTERPLVCASGGMSANRDLPPHRRIRRPYSQPHPVRNQAHFVTAGLSAGRPVWLHRAGPGWPLTAGGSAAAGTGGGGVVAVGGYLAEVMRLASVGWPGVRIQLVFLQCGP